MIGLKNYLGFDYNAFNLKQSIMAQILVLANVKPNQIINYDLNFI